jgi:hypothetical protein
MATITRSSAGGAVTYQNAQVGGDQFAASADSLLHVRNGSSGDITVTITSQIPCSQGVSHDMVYTVPANSDRLIGPLDPVRFRDGNGFVQVHYSAVTTVTVGLIG